jgi:hypothetical protein
MGNASGWGLPTSTLGSKPYIIELATCSGDYTHQKISKRVKR